jgi:hypothetical protein
VTLRSNWTSAVVVAGVAEVTVPALVRRLERSGALSPVEALVGCAELVAAHRRAMVADTAEQARLRRDTLAAAETFLAGLSDHFGPVEVAAFWLSPLRTPLSSAPAVRNWSYQVAAGARLSDAARALTGVDAALVDELLAPFEAAVGEVGRRVLLVGAREPDGERSWRQREAASAWTLLAATQFTLAAADGPPETARRHIIEVPVWLERSPRLRDPDCFPVCTVADGPADDDRARAMLSLWPLPSPEGDDLGGLWDLAGAL